ncbi:MAG: electron transfer flavoprotein subunit beta/FixA family protein [Planctomycetota bacterium]
MNIVVCVKRVAASDTVVKVGADGKSLDPAGVEFVLNPYDEFAVEEAIKTRDAAGGGEITAITLGSSDSEKDLRTCLAMGADKAILLDDGGAARDAYSTAVTIAEHVKGLNPDLVFCGKQAIDGDDSQFPARLAALLDMPVLTEVSTLTKDGDQLRAERDIEGAREVVTCKLPAVVSANKGLNEPRYPNLKGIMAAKKKPLAKVSVEAVAPATDTVSLELPPPRPEGRLFESVDDLIAALKNDAKVL